MEHDEYCEKCHEYTCKCNTGVFSVAVFLCNRAYGGPEEGGWWYDCGEPQFSSDLPLPVFVNGKQMAYLARDEMENKIAELGLNEGRRDINSVLCEGVYHAIICEGPPKAYPETIPHYE